MARSQLTQKKKTIHQQWTNHKALVSLTLELYYGTLPDAVGVLALLGHENRGSIQNSERSYASSNKYNKAMSIQRSTALLLITVDSPWSNSSSSDATSSRGRYKLCTPSVIKFLSPLRGCERTAPCQAAERADPSRACWPRACPAPPPAHRSHLHA